MKVKFLTRVTNLLLVLILVILISGCSTEIIPDTTKPESSLIPVPTETNIEDEKNMAYYPDYTNNEEYYEMNARLKDWLTAILESDNAPFSFTLDGVLSSKLIPSWNKDLIFSSSEKGETFTAVYTDPSTGLEARFEATLYYDLPTVDWVVYFKNTSDKNTSQIANLKSMDINLPLDGEVYTLNTTKGTNPGVNEGDQFDFQPQSYELSDKTLSFANVGGRSSECAWPFFDILGDNCGVVIAVGWTGSWNAEFVSTEEGISATAGRQYFDAYLLPSEEIRTPSCSITYFEGNAEYGHNLWRRSVVNYYTPDDGTEEKCQTPISLMAWGGNAEENLEKIVLTNINMNLGADSLWIDAGWHGNVSPESNGVAAVETWKFNVGNWRYNQYLFPNGNLSKLGSLCDENDIRLIQWFELERAYAGTENIIANPELYFGYTNSNNYLLRLDTEEGYDYMFDYLCEQIEVNKLDIYRQDFNMQPESYWLDNDENGRIGITETYYITNLYRLFDSLLKKYSGLMIDNCASGGRRIDIEMIKRSVALFRTDYTTHKSYCKSEIIQAQTQSLSYWVPLSGTGFGTNNAKTFNNYLMLSYISPAVSLPSAFDSMQLYTKSINLYKEARQYWLGDYYQLIPVSYDYSTPQSYELYREDIESGFFTLYNRPDSTQTTFTVVLKGLEANKEYILINPFENSNESLVVKGSVLMNEGLNYELPASSAMMILFEAVN